MIHMFVPLFDSVDFSKIKGEQDKSRFVKDQVIILTIVRRSINLKGRIPAIFKIKPKACLNSEMSQEKRVISLSQVLQVYFSFSFQLLVK